MKKIIYIYSVIFISLGIISCKNTLLEQAPIDAISEVAVWSDIKLARLYVNDLYNGLPDGLSDWAMLDAASDDADNTFGWPNPPRLNQSDYSPSGFPYSDNWGKYYGYIRRANIALERIDAVKGDTAIKTSLKGEIIFLRAMYYFELTKFWGGIPLITKVQQLNDSLNVTRNTYNECVDFISSECNKAIPLLSLKSSGENKGRIDKGSAMSLKARVLLYSGRWAEAAAAAKAVIDMNQYSLESNYSDIFLTRSSNEVILAKQHINITGQNTNNVDKFSNPSSYGGWGGTTPTQEFVDSYEMTDGKSITASPLYNDQDPYKNRDPRFYETVNYNGAIWKGKALDSKVGGTDGPQGPSGGDASKTSYYMRKWLTESIKSPFNEENLTNWVIFRLAEMHLIYAEAQNEVVGPDPSVYNAVNAVRARSKMPNLPAGLSKDEMRIRIRNERRVELAFEDHRFFDIRRWKIAESLLNGDLHGMSITVNPDNTLKYTKIVFTTRKFFPKNYLLPIAQSEIVKDPKLVQNPGY